MAQRETLYSLRVSKALQRSFAPIKTEPLATYIFSATPKIPSESFATSLVLEISHRLTHSGLSDPRRAFSNPALIHAPRTERAYANLMLSPLRSLCSCLVGVVSVIGTTPEGSVLPFSEALNRGVQSGKFVYDIEDKRLLVVLDNLTEDCLGVVSLKYEGPVRERFFFVIPKAQYSWGNLPKLALVALTNVEYRISRGQGENQNATQSFQKLADMFSSMPKKREGNSVIPVDSFNMSDMANAIENLAKSLAGVYYGPHLKRDVINLQTGELSSRASGKLIAKLSIPDYAGRNRIRHMIAQDYCLKLLPPGSERWFRRKEDFTFCGFADERGEDDVMDGEIDQLQEFQLLDVTLPESQIASEAGFAVASNGYAEAQIPQDPKPVSGDDRQRKKEEERRVRNRLSAARSNERRKQREVAQMKELQSLRERKAVLEEVRRRLADENVALRKQMLGLL